MITGLIPLSIHLFNRGTSGVPTAQWRMSLSGIIDSYEHTIASKFGFESMSCSFVATEAEAMEWFDRLMYSAVVYSPDADVIWEGYLNRVDVELGQERRSISLDSMANRIRVRYTTVLGTPGTTATASNTDSQALYGVKDFVLSIGDYTATAAGNLRDTQLNALDFPKMEPSTTVATGEQGQVRVTLQFLGWYETLGWVLTSNTTTTTAVTTTQVGSLLSTLASTNAFISTSTRNIAASGISDTQYIGPDTSYRTKIEALLEQGNSSNQRLAWGVYEDREFHVAQWAGTTPDTITYKRYLGDDLIYKNGAVADPWNIRPNAMYEVVDILGISLESTPDELSRYFVERVRCSISSSGVSVELEPQQSSALDAMIARLK
jgi:hypothetical protein